MNGENAQGVPEVPTNTTEKQPLITQAEPQITSIDATVVSAQTEPHKFLQSLAERKQQKDNTIPLPDTTLTIDTDAAARWITEETDPELVMVRQKIIDSVDIVPFTEFTDALDKTAANVRDAVKEDQYGVLWDYKPHSSKRWVSQLAAPTLADHPPVQESFFTPGWEARNGYPTLEHMVSQGVTKLVVMDGAIYSGEQIIKRVIQPVYNYIQSPAFKEAHPDTPLTIVIAAPFMTNRFLDQQIITDATAMGLVEVLPPVTIMNTLTESFSEEEKQIIENHGGKISSREGEVFYQAPTTVFDHKIPDSHSFPEEIRDIFNAIPTTPYAREDTQYYKDEAQAFEVYKETVFPSASHT